MTFSIDTRSVSCVVVMGTILRPSRDSDQGQSEVIGSCVPLDAGTELSDPLGADGGHELGPGVVHLADPGGPGVPAVAVDMRSDRNAELLGLLEEGHVGAADDPFAEQADVPRRGLGVVAGAGLPGGAGRDVDAGALE